MGSGFPSAAEEPTASTSELFMSSDGGSEPSRVKSNSSTVSRRRNADTPFRNQTVNIIVRLHWIEHRNTLLSNIVFTLDLCRVNPSSLARPRPLYLARRCDDWDGLTHPRQPQSLQTSGGCTPNWRSLTPPLVKATRWADPNGQTVQICLL